MKKTAKLYLHRGNLVKWEGDAIVNAANERCLGGGGVDGAIHTAAGDELRQACLKLPEVSPGVRCPTGEAKITKGFKLNADYVIHTVGPVYHTDEESEPKLASAYKSSLDLANEYNLKKIAFPAISCGVYRYPLDKAAEVSLKTVGKHFGDLEEVHFVLFDMNVWKPYSRVAQSMFPKADPNE